MKLAYLVSQYPATSHTFIRREVEALRESGVRVETFSIRRPSDAERSAGVDRREFERTWYVLPPSPGRVLRAHASQLTRRPLKYAKTLRRALEHRVPGVRAALWAGFHFAEAVTLADELERRGVDHLHNHFANSGANVGYLASQLLGIDWSLTLHGISEFDYPAGPLLPEKIAAAAFVACVTHFGRAQAMRMVDPTEWDKLFVARCGLDLEPFAERRASVAGASRLAVAEGDENRGQPREQKAQLRTSFRSHEPRGPVQIPPKRAAFRIVTVGRMSAEKGHMGLVEAFAEARSSVDCELRIVGDGPERERVERRASELGVAEHVSFAGRVPSAQVMAELLLADVFAMSSFMEGLPVVIMEALAMEVPVIAPAVAGIPELIVHGETGLLFAPSDWSALAENLKVVASDTARARTMAKRGRARVEEEFEIRKAIAPLLRRFGGGA